MITILSGPIHSGKTTRLLEWSQNQPRTAGILTPVRNGLKTLYDLAEKKYHEFQIPANGMAGPDCIRIGSYRFYRAAFSQGRSVLERAARQIPAWLIIDEIGPLELGGQGFEPTAGRLIQQYRKRETNGDLLLVIRDTLLRETLSHYGIAEYRFFEP
jgi:nucleoside-triphosphatase THEP1